MSTARAIAELQEQRAEKARSLLSEIALGQQSAFSDRPTRCRSAIIAGNTEHEAVLTIQVCLACSASAHSCEHV